ncbi:MAG: superoxide dismutase family protein [Butyricicoccus sp.]
MEKKPCAIAEVVGSMRYPDIHGTVQFYQTEHGVIVSAEVSGLPTPMTYCQSPIFAFHIHSGSQCGGTSEDPFAEAMTHYNPAGCDHPYHAGDMPPLFGCNGYALSIFLTNRFSVSEVIGRTVIIHARPDDFTTQPSGNSGEKIACGQIRSLR